MPTDPSSYIIPSAPVVPDRTNRNTFPSYSFAWYSWMHDSLYGNTNQLASITYNNALEALAAAQTKNLGTFKGVYASGTTYAQGESVYYSGAFYLSNVNANVGNTPASSPTQWTAVYQARQGALAIASSTTLTAGSAANIKFTPSTYGQYVQLPDATTVGTLIAPMFHVFNAGNYDVAIKDSTGVTRAFLQPGCATAAFLDDNTTAAGGWRFCGDDTPFGVTAEYSVVGGVNVGTTFGIFQAYPLDANRTFFLFGLTSLWGQVYDASTATWGAQTLITSSNVNATSSALAQAVVLSSTQVVVAYTISSGASRAASIPLSISGTTLTVGAQVTFASNTSAAFLDSMIVVGSTVLLAYHYTTSTPLNVVAMTVAGNVITSGALNALAASGISNSSVTQCHLYAASATMALAIHNSGAGSWRAVPITISAGTTQTNGTAATWTSTNIDTTKIRTLPCSGGWFAITQDPVAPTTKGTYITVSGTVATASMVNLHGTLSFDPVTRCDAIAINGRVLVMMTDGANGITFVLGSFAGSTLSIATASITSAQMPTGYAAPPILCPAGAGATAARGLIAATSAVRSFSVDCSTATPVVTTRHIQGGQDLTLPKSNGIYNGKRDPTTMLAGQTVYTVPQWSSGAYNKRNSTLVVNPIRERVLMQDIVLAGALGDTGFGNTDSWFVADTAAAQATGTNFFIQHVEVATP